MIMRRTSWLAIALLAGCGSVSSQPPVTASPPAAALPHTATPAAAGTFGGPARVTIRHCGALSPAQQQKYTTNAKAGLIVLAVNNGHAPMQIDVSGEFTKGSTVTGTNTADTTVLQPGQRQQVEMDNYPAGNPHDTCAVTGYGTTLAGNNYRQYGN